MADSSHTDDILLTVAVPLYNAEPWLEQLMENLRRQRVFEPGSRAEVLFVNDGSKDNTAQRVRELQTRYPAIRLVTQPNGGQATARRTILKEARGEYVYFMDQDDVLTPDMLLPQTLCLKENGGDVLRFKYEMPDISRVPELMKRKDPMPWSVEKCMSGKEYIIYTNSLHGQIALWSAIWRTRFIRDNNITFYTDVHYNDDQLFTWQVMLLDPRVVVTDCLGYYWVQNPASHSHDGSADNREKLRKGTSRLLYHQMELTDKLSDSGIDRKIVRMMRPYQEWQVVTCWARVLRHARVSLREALSEMDEDIAAGLLPIHGKPYYSVKDFDSLKVSLTLLAIHRLCKHPWLLKQAIKLRLK